MSILFLFLLCVLIIWLVFKNKKNAICSVVVDLSIFLDGRIYDIVETNFVSFKLIIPYFVIDELKDIYKSSDYIAKSRAKKVLLLIEKLKNSRLDIKIVSLSLNKTENTSLKIINIADSLKAKILTKDFNLYKEASLKNIPVLNINDLEAALYPSFLPGDKISVYLTKEGTQHNQAVGYFDEKTKIVAEDGKNFIGKEIIMTVTSVMFSPTGRIIFGKVSGYDK